MGLFQMGDALNQFLQKSRLKNGVRSVQIEQLWEEMMGKTISRYTESIKLVNHTLFITTHVGPLKQELLYQKEKIVERVNEAFGENVVTEVVIR